MREEQGMGWTLTQAEVRLGALINSPAPADDEAAVEVLGWMIDVSETLSRPEGIEAALVLGESLLSRSLKPAHRVLVHYFLSNAWEVKRLFARSGFALYEWEQPELEQEIIHLRKALLSVDEGEIDPVRLCQIHTNLGNLLSHCGRFIDAIHVWDRALVIDPGFAMALGNRGYGLLHYGEVIHTWHQALFFRGAYADLTRALAAEPGEVHADARVSFEEALSRLEAGVPEHILWHTAHEHRFPDDTGPDELEYRRWCLLHRLFLNDLNDPGEDPLAAADQVTLPGLLMPIGTGIPHAVGFFNQLKQEYVSARYLYYEGVTTEEAHYSDRRVLLANTGDYPSYGIAAERVKAAFRIAYSLFDKVAYFLNDYLALGIPETRVSFRGLWYDRQDRARGLRADLGGAENAPLKGLFWIAKDLFEKEQGFVEAIEPEARELATVRNHLEHKYLKLHLFGPPESPQGADRSDFDALAYSLDRGEFERKTLRLLQLGRTALLHLSMAVHVEERLRAGEKDDSRILTQEIDDYRDEWKV